MDENCKEKYDPSSKHPGVSFMSAEQTFAWLSRFRRILCAIPASLVLLASAGEEKKFNVLYFAAKATFTESSQ